MPSDDSLVTAALAELSEPAEAFHSALARAVEELRTFVARHRVGDADPAALVAMELGAFGDGRVDANRFAALASQPEAVDVGDLHEVERTLELLISAEAKGTDLLRARVPRAGDLREVVSRALADIGRVFGEIRRITPVLEGHGEITGGDSLPNGYPFARWTRAERSVAPPLFVELDGGDLNVAGLSEFLDGSQKIVLVVQGSAPPAPLARLLSPGVFVMQTLDPAALAAVATTGGPAVVAVGTEGLVPFTHDPAAGSCYAERIAIEHIPAADDLSLKDFRQSEALKHLSELATSRTPTATTGNGQPAAVAADEDAAPADRLAGWLLQQAGLMDGGA
jgi:hypothetical protein